MRTLTYTIAVIAIIAIIAAATAVVSSGRRSNDAIKRLESGALRLQECHDSRGTYDGCQSREERVHNVVRDDRFTLSTHVFGVGTFSISARDGSDLRRRCDARGGRCRDDAWTAKV